MLRGMWDLSPSGIEPTSPALAGGFLTTEPPGKPCQVIFIVLYILFFLERIQYVQPMLKEGGFMLLPFEDGVST